MEFWEERGKAGPAVRNPTFFPMSFSGCSGREKRRKKRRISDCGPRLKNKQKKLKKKFKEKKKIAPRHATHAVGHFCFKPYNIEAIKDIKFF